MSEGIEIAIVPIVILAIIRPRFVLGGPCGRYNVLQNPRRPVCSSRLRIFSAFSYKSNCCWHCFQWDLRTYVNKSEMLQIVVLISVITIGIW